MAPAVNRSSFDGVAVRFVTGAVAAVKMHETKYRTSPGADNAVAAFPLCYRYADIL